MSSSPLALAMQVPLPLDGSVSCVMPTPFVPVTRAASGPTMTSFQMTRQHGSSEQVQAHIDNAVDRALHPHTTIMPNPMGIAPAPGAARGRTMETEQRSTTTTAGTTFGGRMLQTETTVQKLSVELGEVDARIVSMQSDIAMMKLHLQHERVADSQRDNVSQSVEQRITAIEQLIQAERLKQTPADPAAAQPIDPLQQMYEWANFLSVTQPPGLGQSGNPAPPAQTSPAVSFGTTNTTSAMVGFIET